MFALKTVRSSLDTLKQRKKYEPYLRVKTKYGDYRRVFRVPWYLVENSIFCSGDGLEEKLVVKDLVYKIQLALTERERKVIRLYYLEDLNMKQVGNELGVTESRISQIHSEVIAYLRERFCRSDAV